MIVLETIVGLVLLVMGGDALVRGAVSTAKRLQVSPLLIGLLLVSFGTSTPELVTSLSAALEGSPGIAIGNVVGSNIANILLILGVTASIKPIRVAADALKRDGTVALLASLFCAAGILSGSLSLLWGAVSLLFLAIYIVYAYRKERFVSDASAAMHIAEEDLVPSGPKHVAFAAILIIGGLVATILGAQLLVSGAQQIATAAGLSDSIVGLTIVAVGTSLPELAASAMAARRNEADVAFGNIVGSNIFNILGILGLTAIIHPMAVPADIAIVEVGVMIAAILFLLLFAIGGGRISRLEGGYFLAGYMAYLGWLAGVF